MRGAGVLGLAAGVLLLLGALIGFSRTDGGTTAATRSIAPMEHWTSPEEEVVRQTPLRLLTTMRTSIGYDDPDIDLSIEQFPEYVNRIAGYDVLGDASSQPGTTYYSCGSDDQESGAQCSTRFRWDYEGREYEVLIDVGHQRNTYSGKPAEIVVLSID